MKKLAKSTVSLICCIAAVLMATAGSGCSILPRARIGSLAAPTVGTPFRDPDKLGTHSYGYLGVLCERNGIVYTCRGGSIDITHLRWNADYTRSLIDRTRNTLMKKGSGFSFNLAFETSTHRIQFHYPDDWDTLPNGQKAEIAEKAAFVIGPYLAYNATMWHEFLTWFGTHFIGVEPEFNSAFAWEDSFSNLMGTHLAVRAMKDEKRTYNCAMTIALNEELAALGALPSKTARREIEKMRGLWYKGYFVPYTYRRSFDMGLDNGYVTAVLIPDVAGCVGDAASYPIWTLDPLEEFGLSITYEIKPNVWEQGKIFRAAGSDRIFPETHFPILLEFARKEAAEKGLLFEE